MSGVTIPPALTSLPGFDRQQYDKLLEEAKAKNIDSSLVDYLLVNAVGEGQSFSDAVNLIRGDLPRLAQPNAAALAALDGWTTLPAPGALIMALITELSAEQREQNRETIWAQTEAVAESMKTEADKMREMAKIQLAMGLVASAVTVAGGLTQGLMTRGGGTGPEAMLTAARAQGAGQAVGGGAGIFSAMGQYFGTMYQAEFKEMEADQEKMRTMRDSIKDFNDGLKELIQKSLASADSIQQSRNQAMTRILA